MRIRQAYLRKIGPFQEASIAFPDGKEVDKADVYLLTGPNGTGKSTVLYALAAALGGRFDTLGRDLALRRMHGADSCVVIDAVEPRFANPTVRYGLAWGVLEGERRTEIRDPFSDGYVLKLRALEGHRGYYRSLDTPEADYAQFAASPWGHVPEAARPRVSWAAFAYAGVRSVDEVSVGGVEEPRNSPFEQSLSFTGTANTNILANWIANQYYRRLKAKDLGNNDVAFRAEQGLADIERIIREVTDDVTFAFQMVAEDHTPRVVRKGKVLDLGLLPDGLKSIMSWIADLLMRLDRIPWIDDTPPVKRPFLLLLDEIDIHLHPAWQRKLLPIVQKIFPNAQIIASTHSPFVVASAADATIISFSVDDEGTATVDDSKSSQTGISYGAIIRSVFGIDSEFDIETERSFAAFHVAQERLLGGDETARISLYGIAEELSLRSDEVREFVSLELRQIERQLAARKSP
jgi:energy-coupling factor transporter ATP-binding protein EcfA2